MEKIEGDRHVPRSHDELNGIKFNDANQFVLEFELLNYGFIKHSHKQEMPTHSSFIEQMNRRLHDSQKNLTALTRLPYLCF